MTEGGGATEAKTIAVFDLDHTILQKAAQYQEPLGARRRGPASTFRPGPLRAEAAGPLP